MIQIENLLLNEESQFLNYKFNEENLYFVKLGQEDSNKFWSFLYENKGYVLGDLIIDGVVVSNQQTKNRINILEDKTFLVDKHIWYEKKFNANRILNKLAWFNNSPHLHNISRIDKLLNIFGLKQYELKKPYEKLDDFEKLSLDIILCVLVSKEYNFILAERWNKLTDEEKNKIYNGLNDAIRLSKQTFILITNTEDIKEQDINNDNYTGVYNLTLSSNTEIIKYKKSRAFNTFYKLSNIIFSMYKLAYFICLLIISLSLATATTLMYSPINLNNNKIYDTFVWMFLAIAFATTLSLWLYLFIRIKKYYRFIQTKQISNASKITYFCYFYLIWVFCIQIGANIIALIINAVFGPIHMEGKYITICIFINIGYIIFNLALTSLWILSYNKK